MRRITPLLLPLALSAAFALSGCAHLDTNATPVADAPVDPVPDVPADDNLNAVLWMQRSAEYRAVGETIYGAAAKQLPAALADPDWDALVPGERDNPATGLPPAIILDVDETVLDNSPYQARLVRGGGEYDEASWDQWVREQQARAVPGVVAFARAASAQGVTLLYLSNRAEHLQAATLANLRAVGMPVQDERVFLGLGTVVDGCEQHGSEKNCRRQLAGRQYRVLMQFGDQLGDFAQVVANTPDGRAALLAEHAAWFGERWWMLPNPSYGSWEPAHFNNAWRQPRAVRRQAKREALDVGQ
jgi:acid phosphatase